MTSPAATVRAADRTGRWCQRCGHRLASSTVESRETRRRLRVCERCKMRLTNLAGREWVVIEAGRVAR